MDKMIDMLNSNFYFNRDSIFKEPLFIKALGIHENMEPCIINHGGKAYPYLFMFFHNQAWRHLADGRKENMQNGFIIWEPSMQHIYGNADKSWDHSWMIIHGSSVTSLIKQKQIPLNQLLLVPNFEQVFCSYMRMIHCELKSKPYQDNFMLQGIISLLLHELSRMLLAPEIHHQIPDNIKAADDFILSNFNKNINIKEIASKASLSIPRFIVVFKKYFDETPIQRLLRTRMDRAAQLLQYNHLSIKQISREVGFNDQLYFSRKFQQHFNCCPSVFRNKNNFIA